MAGNQRGILSCKLLDESDGIEHSAHRSAVCLIGERIAEVPVEILDVSHVRLPEADDGVAGRMRRHHRDEVDRLAVHIDGDRRFSWHGRVWIQKNRGYLILGRETFPLGIAAGRFARYN